MVVVGGKKIYLPPVDGGVIWLLEGKETEFQLFACVWVSEEVSMVGYLNVNWRPGLWKCGYAFLLKRKDLPNVRSSQYAINDATKHWLFWRQHKDQSVDKQRTTVSFATR